MSEKYAELNLWNGDATSLTLRGINAKELQEMIVEAKRQADLAPFFGGSAPAASTAGQTPADATSAFEVPAQRASNPLSQDSTSDTDGSVSETEALANIQKHLGAGEELASSTLIAAAAKKSGKTEAELQGISRTRALAIIKGEES